MENKNPKLEGRQFAKVIFWVFKIYFKMGPLKTMLMVLSRSLADLKGLVYAYIFAKAIDQLIFTSQVNKDFSLLIPYLVAIFLSYVIMEGLVESAYRYSSRGLRHVSRSELEMFLYQQLNRLGIQNLEDPETVNRIQRSRHWIFDTYGLLQEAVVFIANIVRAMVACTVIISFFPIMAPVLIILTIIKFFPDKHFIKQDFHWQVDNSENRRNARHTANMLASPNTLQEIGIVGAYKFLNRKYSKFYSWYNAGILRIFQKREISNFLLNILDSAVGVIGYGIIFTNFLYGKITLGTLTFQMRALDTFSSSMQRMLTSITYLNELAIKMNDLVMLFEMEPAVGDGNERLPRLDTPPEIEFKNVSFKYPNSERYIFNNLNFKINSGEKVALVGHNGAGKTTIVKLIARIYQVTKGEILINGININTLSINDWHKNLGVLFQDYNFYSHLTVKENIYIGRSAKKVDDKKIIEAAKNADAYDFINEYKNKFDQVMSEKFEGGIRPSAGQQQKIAIARFFYRDAPLAIFDEPTAAVDAVSEYKIFNKIYRFFTNKTVIIISHRFSTVRNADRIIVIKKGKIVEEGSHDDLIKADGVYHSAYKLQAVGYQS